MSDEKLLRCPFCGGEATIHKSKFGYGVMCKTPFCCDLTSANSTEEDAIRMWNTRKPMERIVEQLEERKNHADNMLLEFKGTMTGQRCEVRSEAYKKAIEIVKGGGADETD